MAKFRIEKDFLGKVMVPSEAYYGAETARAMENFKISGMSIGAGFIKSYTMIKRAAAITNLRLGKLDPKISKAIVRACDEVIKGKFKDQFVVDIFQAGAGTSTNMNINEVLANRAIELLGGKRGDYKLVNPNDHVNMSQSTNDTYHAAIHLTVYSMIKEELIPEILALQKALEKKSKEFMGVVKIGRTHLQDAVPIALGQEFSGYASSMGRESKNIEQSIAQLLYLPLGGTAVGTGIGATKDYPKIIVGEINDYTGYDFKVAKNFFDVQQNQNEETWTSSSLRDLSIALNKIANDLRLMASGPAAGFEDIVLPPVQPGSSIMPGKVNPSMPEMLNMVCFEVIGNDATIAYAAESGQLELNVYMPIIAFNLVNSVSILANGIREFNKRCIAGIKANEKRLSAEVRNDISLATALSPYIGYASASKIARRALKEGKTVKQVAMELKILPKEDLERVLNPKRLTKPR